MKHKSRHWRLLVWGLGLFIFSFACSTFSGNTTSTATPTPTEMGGGGVITPTVSENRCAGLSGAFELQVLVGPAEVVGLEPIAIGEVPFSVVSNGGANIVQGGGSMSYQDVLEREWGTYTVSFDLDADVNGECTLEGNNAALNVTLEVTGDQLVEVDAQGFKGEYPWSGTYSFDLSLPAEDGASAGGEGWTFVLHLSN